MQLAIFGAQGYALGAYKAMKTLYPERRVSCFLVSSLENNAPSLQGIPVREVAEFAAELSEEERATYEILIATPENVQPEIEELLDEYGFRNHQRLTSERWGELMKCYHAKAGEFMPLAALPVGSVRPKMRIYMAKFYKGVYENFNMERFEKLLSVITTIDRKKTIRMLIFC